MSRCRSGLFRTATIVAAWAAMAWSIRKTVIEFEGAFAFSNHPNEDGDGEMDIPEEELSRLTRSQKDTVDFFIDLVNEITSWDSFQEAIAGTREEAKDKLKGLINVLNEEGRYAREQGIPRALLNGLTSQIPKTLQGHVNSFR